MSFSSTLFYWAYLVRIDFIFKNLLISWNALQEATADEDAEFEDEEEHEGLNGDRDIELLQHQS